MARQSQIGGGIAPTNEGQPPIPSPGADLTQYSGDRHHHQLSPGQPPTSWPLAYRGRCPGVGSVVARRADRWPAAARILSPRTPIGCDPRRHPFAMEHGEAVDGKVVIGYWLLVLSSWRPRTARQWGTNPPPALPPNATSSTRQGKGALENKELRTSNQRPGTRNGAPKGSVSTFR